MREYSYPQFLRPPGMPYNLPGNQEPRKWIKSCESFRLCVETYVGNRRVFAGPAIAISEAARPNESKYLFSSAAPRIPTSDDASRAIRDRPLVPSRPDDEQYPES
jgi:hypothetical protein